MALSMIRPTRHPKTGVYQLRGRVPAEVAHLVEKKTFKASLRTKDPAVAKERAPKVLAELQATWKKLSIAHVENGGDAIVLSTRQVEAIAGEIYAEYVKRHQDEPGARSVWVERLSEWEARAEFRKKHPGMAAFRNAALANLPAVDAYLQERGFQVTGWFRSRIAASLERHLVEANNRLLKNADGDYTPDEYAKRFPTYDAPSKKRTLEAIFELYADQAGLAPSTRMRFKAVIKKLLFEHIGRDDFGAITTEKLNTWRDKLFKEGLSPRTVRDVHLAAVKAACAWAVSEKLLPNNPAVGVKVTVKDKPSGRSQKGYSYEEAKIVLAAAAGVTKNGRLAPDRYAARRWVPWICAYTGARVNEITQLRAEDIFSARDEHASQPIWMFRITPEAGSTKNGMSRDVAIHEHLIDQGFLEFVRGVKSGPLFYDPGRARGGSAAHPIYKKTGERLAAWVRDLGVSDPALQPNHGWRHRFKTICLTKEIEEVIVNRIMGHAEKDEGQKYGDVWPSASKAAIDKIPRYRFDEREDLRVGSNVVPFAVA